MKLNSAKVKSIIVIIVFSALFIWWYKQIYIVEKDNGFKADSRLSANGKVVFGLPFKNNLVHLEYTGFISGFDTLKKNPLWIAYNLKKPWLKATKTLSERDFRPDPSLPKIWMADLKDFKRSGYDRGHLARQADMRGRNLKCEQEACYLTNITAQKSDFNQKTWLNLENAVQKWALKYDSLWVIAGPWFDQKRELLNNNSEIPDGFYKIVVKCLNRNFYITSFVFKQTDKNLDLNSYTVSVDSIENLTRIDFFRDLPDSLEDRIEKRRYKIWQGWR